VQRCKYMYSNAPRSGGAARQPAIPHQQQQQQPQQHLKGSSSSIDNNNVATRQPASVQRPTIPRNRPTAERYLSQPCLFLPISQGQLSTSNCINVGEPLGCPNPCSVNTINSFVQNNNCIRVGLHGVESVFRLLL